jgi:hypothetical protein
MINAQILALRERKKREKEFKKRAQSRNKIDDASYQRIKPFSSIACGIATIKHSTDWAMKYAEQQDNMPRGSLIEKSLNSSLKK